MNSRVTTLRDCGMLTSGVLILVATDVLFAYTPTVPVRASCVPLTGQAACTAVLGSGAPGGGAIGGGALSCDVCTGDAERGFECGASTVTCGKAVVLGCCCAGVSAGDEDIAGCVEGDSCAGASTGGGDSFSGRAWAGGGSRGGSCVAPAAPGARYAIEKNGIVAA